MAFRTSGSRAGSDIFGYRPTPLPKPTPQSDLRRATPGYDQMLAELTGNITSNLNGVLPQDVINFVADQANARAVAGGYGGSGLGNNLTLRDLGLTSLQRMDTGAQQFMNFLPIQSRTATVDPALLTQIEEFNSLAAAAPDPAKRAAWEEDQFQKYLNSMIPSQPITRGSIPSGGGSYGGFSSGGSIGYGGYTPIPVNNFSPVIASGTRTAPLAGQGWVTGPMPKSNFVPTAQVESLYFSGNSPSNFLNAMGSDVDAILASHGINPIV